MSLHVDEDWSDEQPFSPSFSITESNLLQLDERISRADERRICELSLVAKESAEAAVRLLKNGIRMDEVLALMSTTLTLPRAILHADALEDNIARLRLRSELRRTSDEAIFSELFCQSLASAGVRLHESTLLPTESKQASVAYVKNIYADEAFDVFAQDRPRMKPVMVRSFSEAVERMHRSEVGYCLFPLAEEGGTRLASVQSLIYRNDLKIVAITPVFGYDGTAELTYALLAPSFDPIIYEPTDDLYLEIALAREDSATLGTVLSATQFFGITVFRTDTVSYMTSDDKRTVCSLVLRDHRHTLFSFLCYLLLFVPDFTPIGLYKNVE